MKDITPRDGHALLQQQNDAVLVDVRSEMEFLFVGHPVGAINIPWNDGPDWEINPHFVAQVRKVASEHRTVVLICRSGARSADAGQTLEAAGFRNVYNIRHGFEGDLDEAHQRGNIAGWRHDGLPWEQC